MKKRLLSIVTCLALCLSLLPAVSLTASAAETADKTIMWGTSGIGDPVAPDGTDSNALYTYDYVYFGNYQQSSDGNSGYITEPIKWRVLDDNNDYNTNSTAEGESALFLLSDIVLDQQMWDSDDGIKDYGKSAIRTWLNGTFLSTAFGNNERTGIAATYVQTANVNVSYNNATDTYKTTPTTDKVFLLSNEEALSGDYGLGTDAGHKAGYSDYAEARGVYTYDSGAYWWLRSPGSKLSKFNGYAAYFSPSGARHGEGFLVNRKVVGVRPAFNLDTSKVLFTSAADNSAHQNFAAPASYDGSEWKVTLKDGNDFSTDASISATDLTIGYEATGLTITHKALADFDAGYTNVTAVLTNGSGNILYYGSINTATDATSSTVTIPVGLAEGTYTLSVYGEAWNDVKETDYATGTPFTTEITVSRKPLTADMISVDDCVYDATEQRPKVTVTDNDVTLTEGKDYEIVEYTNNVNASTEENTAKVTIKGIGNYTGQATQNFTIDPAPLTITAAKLFVKQGEPAPDLTSASNYYTVSGMKGSDSVDEVLGSITLSYDETPDTSELGSLYYILIDETVTSKSDNYDDPYLENGMLRVVECVHNFTEFYAEGGSIFAECSEGCTEEVLTISADDAVYAEGQYQTADLTCDEQIGYHTAEDIVYGPADKLTGGEPTNAGTYTASYTYQGVTATVTYKITPRPLTIKADNKSVYVNGSEPEYTYTVTGWDEDHEDDDPYDHQVSGVTVACDGADLTKTGTYEITLTGTPVVEDSEGNNVSANYTLTTQNGTLTVSNQPSSGGGSSSTTTATTKNEDGSTTTTTTNKTTGTVTETTKTADGTTGTVVTDKNGEVTEISAKVPTSAAEDAVESGEAVTLPIEVEAANASAEAVEIEVDVPSGGAKVEIPVEDVTAGTVVVIVNKDGTEEIVKSSTVSEDGVVVTLEKDATIKIIDNSKHFEDVHPADHWAEEAVDFVVAREIFGGTSANTFTPNGSMTRQAMWMVLARMSGEDPADMAEAKTWAVENSISDGSNPTNAVTRQQFVTMLWRWSQSWGVDVSVGEDTNILSYEDAFGISEYAIPAVQWACGEGIMGGYADGTLRPHSTATRAHVATFIQRFYENAVQ